MIYKKHIPNYPLGGVLSGATSGASIGSIFPGPGNIIGAGVGAVMGLVGGISKRKQEKKERERLREAQALEQQRVQEIHDQQVLGAYDSQGDSNFEYYAKGGKIYNTPQFSYQQGGTVDLQEGADYEVEGGEVIEGNAQLESGSPIANNMQVVQGPSHEGGGVMGTGGERVFSDRLKPEEDIKQIFDLIGLGKPKGKTYAELAESLGKSKGKMESKLESNSRPSVNTAEQMLPKIDAALDILFEDQESSKSEPYSGIDPIEFRQGGQLPKPYTSRPDFSMPSQEIERQLNTFNPIGRTSIGDVMDMDRNITESSIIPNAISLDIEETPNSQIPNSQRIDWGSIAGHVGNLGSFLSNRADIDKLDTSVNRTYLPAPVYDYRDRSGTARREVNRMVRSGQRALGTSSQTVNAANQAAIMSQGLQAQNAIQQAENERRDRYDNIYQNRAWQTNAQNAAISNESSDQRRELYNMKNVYAPQQARAAFMQGVRGNEAVRMQRKTDRDRLMMSALLNDNNGVLTRAAEKFPAVQALIDKFNF